MDILVRMKELIEQLNKAAKEYYQNDNEIMSNKEYDALYDELLHLETMTGIILSNSPSQKVGYEIVSKLPKVKHESKMLSLDKTKNVGELETWLNDQMGVLSWKLDGLTIVLTYNNGKLTKAVTRGNGEFGEIVTNNAKTFINIPLNIPLKNELVIRGEAVITYSNFEEINANIPLEKDKYKNPRNLCSGTVRQLDNSICAKRKVKWIAFKVVSGLETLPTYNEQLWKLEELGFEVVDRCSCNFKGDVHEVIDGYFKPKLNKLNIPTDGLVMTFECIDYGKSLGSTSKFPRHSMAFKWKDDTQTTTLRKIEWQTSRTGLINPVAIFDPVELEGTTVERASLHNLSIIEGLELGIEDNVTVYKANMIIPQIAENLTRSNSLVIPTHCPVCGGIAEIQKPKDTKILVCTNPDCAAKQIKKFTHFVGRNYMNIDGLSEATLEKFISKGWLKDYIDIYYLEEHKDEIIGMDGFGEKSYYKLIKAIEKSKENVSISNFIAALGIDNIGKTASKLIAEYYGYNIDMIFTWNLYLYRNLLQIDGIGEVLARSFNDYIRNLDDSVEELIDIMDFEIPQGNEGNNILEGKTFVVTGSVNHFKNRKELQAKIEELGGKNVGSVSKNTSYLLNNDKQSSSSKNKKAKELNIPIISEEEFVKMIGEK